MKTRLLELVCCAKCKRDLRLMAFASRSGSGESESEIEEGILSCSCGELYPVVAGIPRLLPNGLHEFSDFVARHREALAGRHGSLAVAGHGDNPDDKGQRQVRERFEFQWDRWGDEERIFGKSLAQMIENVTNERIGTHIRADFYPGKLVLDAGCGHGRYLAAFSSLGAEVVGLDLGRGIEVAHRYSSGRSGVHLVQADILQLPLKALTFDLVFCDGVLHHTPFPQDAFLRLAEAVKPGGYLYIWVYPRGGALWEYSQAFIRSITTRLPPQLLYYLCFVPVPLLSFVKTYSGTSLRNSSWRQCAQVVWDWYSPQYQWHHTEEEVCSWYELAGFQDVEFLPVPVGAIGRKPVQ